MGYEPTAYDWALRKIVKAPWPGDMEPSWEFQRDLAYGIVANLEGHGLLSGPGGLPNLLGGDEDE